jgi:prepilin-type N-terminal cleavage/methylation domain-containing protein
MNTLFKANLLKVLANKKSNKGFTLIELLVVVIIIGVLAAVALPNLLGQVGKARETEGKNGVGTINRAQQAYHFEKKTFANAVDTKLANNALGSVVESEYYTFTVAGDATTATADAASTDAVNNGTRNYLAAISYDAGKYYTAVCQSEEIGGTATADFSTITDPNCSAGTELE